jgi:integrase
MLAIPYESGDFYGMETVNSDQGMSTMGKKTAGKLPEEITKRTFSKTDARYWMAPGRLFKDHGVADFSCRFSVRGQRAQLCLGTPNQREAAKRAAELVALVTASGWEAGFALYRPAEKQEAPLVVTLGMVIEASARLSSARRHSVTGYANALRLIAAEIKGIRGDATKFDAHNGGAAKWRASVEAIRLDSITPADVIAWKNKRLRAADGNPLEKRRAVISTNSLIRNAKTIFSPKILPFIEQIMPLPRPLPFEGVPLEKSPSVRYISTIDPVSLLAKAKEELAESAPEAFKVLILALVVGLRRAEIDHLTWSAFDFPGARLRVESSEFHELKSADSAGAIDLDSDAVALFRGYRAQAPKDIFVIQSRLAAAESPKPGRYRCEPVFKAVIAWLRANGVSGAKPIHTLRKEIGSIIASEQGIFEASRYLRHADIHITAATYADKKKVVTPKTFAGLLGNPEVIPATPMDSQQLNG